MTALTKIARVAMLALFISLLIGTDNLQSTPLLGIFVLLMAVTRLAELFNPAAEALSQWHRAEDYPRWLTWLGGMAFLTNLVIPVLDHRYRLEEVFWTSSLPASPGWNWLGLVFLLAGAALKVRLLLQARAQQPPATAAALERKKDKFETKREKGGGKRKPGAAKMETKAETPAKTVHLPASVRHSHLLATGFSYFGIAVLFTSLWALIALVVIFVPVAYHRFRWEERALAEQTAQP